MIRFRRSLACEMLLVFAFPLLAQEQPATLVRVPPPPADATAPELEKQGDDLRAQKAFLDSIDYYRAGMKKSDSAVLHNKAGISYLQLQRDKEAKKEFQRAIQLDKNYPEPYNNLGALNYNRGRYGDAVKDYKKALHLNPENAAFHSNLGGAYFAERDWPNAIREYTRAKELDPMIFDRQSSGGVSIKLISSTDLGRFHYMMAQITCRQGDQERCHAYLGKANEEGYPVRDALRDEQFAGLRKNPDFVTFVRSLKPPQSSNE